jgi:hypothetical protein
MGIEPYFNLWNYFIRVRLWLDPDTEPKVLGCVDVYVRPRQGANPYFCLSVSNLPFRWLFLWNDTTAPLLEVTGRRPAGGTGWPRKIYTSYSWCSTFSIV